jgi:hypothetical protein
MKTIGVALYILKVGYAQEDWPDKGKPGEGFGEIIIRGKVTASSEILIEGTGYPSIILRGESESGGALTWTGNANAGYLLTIKNGAKVTLEEGLTRTVLNDALYVMGGAFNDALVYVENGAFTMNSGEIAGNSTNSTGRGCMFPQAASLS